MSNNILSTEALKAKFQKSGTFANKFIIDEIKSSTEPYTVEALAEATNVTPDWVRNVLRESNLTASVIDTEISLSSRLATEDEAVEVEVEEAPKAQPPSLRSRRTTRTVLAGILVVIVALCGFCSCGVLNSDTSTADVSEQQQEDDHGHDHTAPTIVADSYEGDVRITNLYESPELYNDVVSTLEAYPSWLTTFITDQGYEIVTGCPEGHESTKTEGACSISGFHQDSVIHITEQTLNRSGRSKWVLSHEIAHAIQFTAKNCVVAEMQGQQLVEVPAWELLEALAGDNYEAAMPDGRILSSDVYPLHIGALEVTADLFPATIFPEFDERVGAYAHKAYGYTYQAPTNTAAVWELIIANCIR